VKTIKAIAEELGLRATYVGRLIRELEFPVEGYTPMLRMGKPTTTSIPCYPDDTADQLRIEIDARKKARKDAIAQGWARRKARLAEQAKHTEPAQGPIITSDADRILQAGIRDMNEVNARFDVVLARLEKIEARLATIDEPLASAAKDLRTLIQAL
jgi:hypothetical protein